MVRRLLVTALAVSVPLSLMLSVPAAHAQRSEQLVFSGEGEGSLGEVEFWIWCQVESENPYETDCNGAMRFDDLQLARHVTGDSSEGAQDQYTMDVASSDGAIACTLTNEPPIQHGPHNTIDIACTSPLVGTATSTTAVVNNNG
jgi:hypothetical protein